MAGADRHLTLKPALIGLFVAATSTGALFLLMVALGLAGATGRVATVLSVDYEDSVASWAASVMLALMCALARLISMGTPERRGRVFWRIVAVALLAMSIDETISIHERSPMILEALGIDTDWMWAFGFAWVPVGLTVVALVALPLFWLRHAVPASTWRGLILGGAVFVIGAAGIEVPAGLLVQADQGESWSYLLLAYLEELLEFTGLLIAGLTLNRHLATHAPIALRASHEGSAPIPDGAPTTGR